MRWIDFFWESHGGSTLAGIAKVSAAIALLSVIAANFVSTQTAGLDSERLTQVGAAAAKGQPIDPLVTGSIRKSAAETRLDPCVLPR